MRKTYLAALIMAILLQNLGCSSAGRVEPDVGTGTMLDAKETGSPEINFQDNGNLTPDVVELVTPDANSVKDSPVLLCDPGEGCFLDKCADNQDCQSGWCVLHMGEGVCSQTCQEECPAGWSCQQVAGTDPDVVYICVSSYANLCRPCSTNTDCTSTGGAADACIDYGPDGNFCGGPCGDVGECPWGFSCDEVTTVGGTTIQQCVNDTGECPCTDSSVALGLTTPCSTKNDVGNCQGKRTCTEEGLSVCDASVPTAETCNGLDDDCDDEVDEPDLVDGNYVNLCDDDNDCTEDKCTGAEGCINEVLDTGPCEDGDPCTVADHCVAGTCIGDPVECDDQDPCTDNVCIETGGCEYPPNDAPCDDENPCTVADQCTDGECTGISMNCQCLIDEDCAQLEDGDFCNGSLICDTAALPYKCVVDLGTVVTCPEPEGENTFCQQANCDPGTGDCSFVPNHEGFLCDNGNACTVNDKCIAGECAGGSNVNCNDGNPCTDDSCETEVGCLYDNNGVPCNDGDLCTTEDLCVGGLCVGGPAPDCDDGNECTTDSCDPGQGCTQEAALGECDDGNACTEGDHCEEGKCVHSDLTNCDDDEVCTTESCDPATGCVYATNENLCSDKNLCTIGDQCQAGVCVSGGLIECDDGNECTEDLCNAVLGCEFTLNQAECDDDNECTIGDICTAGWCVPGIALVCDDGNECTVDTCEAALGCLVDNLPDGTPCAGDDPQIVCVDGECACQSACDGSDCGPDGCGGACGECGEATVCVAGQCEWGVLGCGDLACPPLVGYSVSCNPQDHCEYANEDGTGWKAWDIWIWIPPGAFPLGGPDDEPGHDPAEGPMHGVTFAKGYFISKYEIVVEQYEACIAANPGKCTPASTVDWDGNGWGTNTSANNRSHHPQNGLTWQQARDFCGWVAPGGRLPSEAQWEYAAKGPVHRKYPWGDSPLPTCTNKTATFNEAGEEAGYGCGLGGTSEAGSKTAGTSWCGALDMAGNLWEWCEDWWHPTYEGAPWDGSAWVDDGTWRVVRGGSFDTSAFHLRTSWRPYHTPTHRFANDGARCVRHLPGDCVSDCDGKECGDDGCGGSCGECDAGFKCFEGQCAPLPLQVWSTSFKGTKPDNVQDVAVDEEGNTYLLGVYESTTLLLGDDILGDELLENAGDTDMLLVKLDSEGELLWSASIGGEEAEYPYSLSLDSQGNAYVVGDYFSTALNFGNGAVGNAGKNDVFVAKFSAAGVFMWSKTAGGSDYDRGRGIAVRPNGDMYVAGSFMSESIDFGGGPLQNAGGDCAEIGCSDFFVSSFSSAGLHLWSKSLGGDANDDCFSAVADAVGNLYVGGRVKSEQLQIGDDFVGSSGKGDVLVFKMTPAGEYVWGRAFGGDEEDSLYSLSADSAGNVYLIGDFMSPSIDFGGGPLVNKGDQDIFLVKLDADGTHVFSRSYGGSQRDNGYSVAVGNDGMVYFTGYFATQTINFGGDTFVLSGSKDIYLAKLNGAGDHIWSRQYGGTGDEWGWSLDIDASGNLLLGGCFRSPTIDFGGGPLVHSNNGTYCDLFVAKFGQ
jgi:formylglycine-generating enzyme required for sulfatase activity